MLKLFIFAAVILAQYPLPDPHDKPTCRLDPAVNIVFDSARECPSHTLRFEYRDDGTFRVVCLTTTKANKLYPKR
jgi:hypothetical protein